MLLFIFFIFFIYFCFCFVFLFLPFRFVILFCFCFFTFLGTLFIIEPLYINGKISLTDVHVIIIDKSNQTAR